MNKVNRAGILGVGQYVPDRIVKNKEFEQTLNTTDEWIVTRTGIKERRIAGEEMDTSDMAALASLDAIQHAGMKADDIDLILVATATPDYNGFPSVACLVQEKIKANPVGAFDISGACTGFIYAMIMAAQFIETGAYRHVLVIGAEKVSKRLDWTDRNTSILFGDGAGAIVMGPVSESKGILAFDMGSDGKGAEQLVLNQYIEMNGREVYKFAVRQMPKTVLNAVENAGLRMEDVDFLIPHQANVRIIEEAINKLGLSRDKVSVTLDQYANTCAATIPLSLKKEIDTGRIKDGDVVVMVGFGGGLTWGSLAMRWGI